MEEALSVRVRALKAGRFSSCVDVVTGSLSAHHAHKMVSDCYSLKKENQSLVHIRVIFYWGPELQLVNTDTTISCNTVLRTSNPSEVLYEDSLNLAAFALSLFLGLLSAGPLSSKYNMMCVWDFSALNMGCLPRMPRTSAS